MTTSTPTPSTLASRRVHRLRRRATSVRSHHAVEGARDVTPMVLGVIPFALAIGAVIGASSASTGAGLAGGPIILAGAAQLATLEMLGSGTSAAVIVASALLINARIVLFSASLAPWFAERSLPARLLLALPVIDQLQLTCVPRFERGDLDADGRLAYYVGAATWLVVAWVGAQTAAACFGAALPPSAHLEMAGPLALVGLLARSTPTSPTVVAAGSAVAVVAALPGLPWHSTVLVATLVGIAAGVAVSTSSPWRRNRDEAHHG